MSSIKIYEKKYPEFSHGFENLLFCIWFLIVKDDIKVCHGDYVSILASLFWGILLSLTGTYKYFHFWVLFLFSDLVKKTQKDHTFSLELLRNFRVNAAAVYHDEQRWKCAQQPGSIYA